MRNEIDTIDLLILKTIYDKSSVSIRELCAITLIRGPSALLYRLRKLEELGLLAPPPKTGQHRSRTITNHGVYVLEEQKVIQKCKKN